MSESTSSSFKQIAKSYQQDKTSFDQLTNLIKSCLFALNSYHQQPQICLEEFDKLITLWFKLIKASLEPWQIEQNLDPEDIKAQQLALAHIVTRGFKPIQTTKMAQRLQDLNQACRYLKQDSELQLLRRISAPKLRTRINALQIVTRAMLYSFEGDALNGSDENTAKACAEIIKFGLATWQKSNLKLQLVEKICEAINSALPEVIDLQQHEAIYKTIKSRLDGLSLSFKRIEYYGLSKQFQLRLSSQFFELNNALQTAWQYAWLQEVFSYLNEVTLNLSADPEQVEEWPEHENFLPDGIKVNQPKEGS